METILNVDDYYLKLDFVKSAIKRCNDNLEYLERQKKFYDMSIDVTEETLQKYLNELDILEGKNLGF